MDKQKGLTLVELMVVIAVIAVIAGIAYPLYTSQVEKTRRADAKIALGSVALAQERFFTINGRYTGNLSSLQVSSEIQGGFSDQGYYDISVGASTLQFIVTAEKLDTAAQSGDDDCAKFTIDQLGRKGAKNASDADATKCW